MVGGEIIVVTNIPELIQEVDGHKNLIKHHHRQRTTNVMKVCRLFFFKEKLSSLCK